MVLKWRSRTVYPVERPVARSNMPQFVRKCAGIGGQLKIELSYHNDDDTNKIETFIRTYFTLITSLLLLQRSSMKISHSEITRYCCSNNRTAGASCSHDRFHIIARVTYCLIYHIFVRLIAYLNYSRASYCRSIALL